MFALCSLLFLSATPDASTTIHAPPPCRTPAELHAVIEGEDAARWNPSPLRSSPEKEFQRFLDGTLDAYFRSRNDEQQAWLDEFELLIPCLGGVLRSPPHPWVSSARERLLAVIVDAFRSDPPRSQDRAMRWLLQWRSVDDELMKRGLGEIVNLLRDPTPQRGVAAAGVLRYIAIGGTFMSYNWDEVVAKASQYGWERLEPYDRLAEPQAWLVAVAIQDDLEAMRQLVPLGFDHGSDRAAWLIGLLPKDKAFDLLQDRIVELKCDGRLSHAIHALKRADAPRLDSLMDQAAPKVLPRLEMILASETLSMTDEDHLFLDHLARIQPDMVRDWFWNNLTKETHRVDSRQDLAAWGLSSAPAIVEQLAAYLSLSDSNPYVRPYAALALAKIDSGAALPFLRDCYENQPPDDCESPLRRDWPKMLSNALIAAGATDHMDEMLAKARAVKHPQARLNSLVNVAEETQTEEAILAMLEELRGSPHADMFLAGLDIKEWPSQKAKDAFSACMRDFLDNPNTRVRAANILLDGLGKDAYPDIAKMLQAADERTRSDVLVTIARTEGDDRKAAQAFLKQLHASTSDPAFKEQIATYIPQNRLMSQMNPRVDPFGPILPSLTESGWSILEWWQIASAACVLVVAAFLLHTRKERKRTLGVARQMR